MTFTCCKGTAANDIRRLLLLCLFHAVDSLLWGHQCKIYPKFIYPSRKMICQRRSIPTYIRSLIMCNKYEKQPILALRILVRLHGENLVARLLKAWTSSVPLQEHHPLSVSFKKLDQLSVFDNRYQRASGNSDWWRVYEVTLYSCPAVYWVFDPARPHWRALGSGLSGRIRTIKIQSSLYKRGRVFGYYEAFGSYSTSDGVSTIQKSKFSKR